MGKNRREIVSKLIFAKSAFSVLIRCDAAEQWHNTFAYLEDECDKLITLFLSQNIKSRKGKSSAINDATYIDAKIEFIRNELKIKRVPTEDESKHSEVFLCSVVVILLDDVFQMSSNKMKKKVDHLLSSAGKCEFEMDKKGLLDNVRDDAVNFIEEIINKGGEYDKKEK